MAGALLALLPAGPAYAATITVNSTADTTADDGECTLREAITAANTNTASGAMTGECAAGSGTDTIEFDIDPLTCTPVTFVCIIQPTTSLPFLTEAVTIDGFSQTGAAPAGTPLLCLNPANEAHCIKIQIDGGSNVDEDSGLVSLTDDAVIQGLSITNFNYASSTSEAGIVIFGIFGVVDNVISGNYIGLNPDGTSAGNGDGVSVRDATGTAIGGDANAERNVISGNTGNSAGFGVLVQGTSTGTTISANYIGLDPTGELERANNLGVEVTSTADGQTIGGDTAGERNVISGNNGTGIEAGSSGNVIQGNYIGPDKDGDENNVGNGSIGVWTGFVSGEGDNTIGGTAAGERNVVAANDGHGVLVDDNGAGPASEVLGNYIGVDKDGDRGAGGADMGNGGTGIRVGPTFAADDVVIGGATAGAGNVVSDNGDHGISVGNDSTDTTIQGNRIGTDSTGESALGNDLSGVLIDGSGPNYVGSDTSGATSGTTAGGPCTGSCNLISGNGESGVHILPSFLSDDADDNVVRGNFIGTDVDGNQDRGNIYGVLVEGADGTKVGGTGTGEGNVVSGNDGAGVYIADGSFFGGVPANTVVLGNLIGTDAAGENGSVPNADGVVLQGADGAAVGDGSTAGRNVISDNSFRGVNITSGTVGASLLGNYIGVDDEGNTDAGNVADGVLISGDSINNLIGGSAAGFGNVISGNGGIGVYISQSTDPSNNVVEGNRIGTDAAGTADLGNDDSGVRVDQGATENTIGGSTGTTVNGACTGSCNVIAFNGTTINSGADGVTIADATTDKNLISQNSIFENQELGIDLNVPGVTPNDEDNNNVADDDTDSGPNEEQNFPNLESARFKENQDETKVKGLLLSEPDESYTLEFFKNDACDASGHGEGETLLGSDTVVTNSEGEAEFDLTLAGATLVVGDQITATASDSETPNGTPADPNTSEFSACVEATVIHVVNSTHDDPDANPADGSCDTGQDTPAVSDGVTPECTLRAAIQQANHASGGDDIEFEIPADDPGCNGAGICTIEPTSQLPVVTDPVTIDGFTQENLNGTADPAGTPVTCPGVVHCIKIQVDGTNAGTGSDGLEISAGDSLVRGLSINDFPGNGADGIEITTNGDNIIEGNHLGLNPTGITAKPNGDHGVFLNNVSDNLIGGTTTEQRNVVSGNSNNGVLILNGPDNDVFGNFIGTTGDGEADLGNGNHGISVLNSEGNQLGNDRNVISGNEDAGISLAGQSAINNLVQGNYIGTDKDGVADLGNTDQGVIISDAPDNTIGGTTGTTAGGPCEGDCNVISGNGQAGVEINGQDASDIQVLGNFIGTNAAGDNGVGNSSDGVFVNVAPDAQIGDGTVAGRNVISDNGTNGVRILGLDTPGSPAAALIEGNYIGSDAVGNTDVGNTEHGVLIDDSFGNTVGGVDNTPGDDCDDDCNLISGNGADGVHIKSADSASNTVSANIIGLDAAGMGDLGNDDDGVQIVDAGSLTIPSSNTVGGTSTDRRNVISGNSQDGGVDEAGVRISGIDPDNNVIQGNYIGTNTTGEGARANQNGVRLVDANGTDVGGIDPDMGNLISGNTSMGLEISGAGAMDNGVQGNFIGTNDDGEQAVPNGNKGIFLTDDASQNNIGGTANTPGGDCTGTCNLVSGNGGDGISFFGSDSNTIFGNYVGLDVDGEDDLGNTGIGIDLDNSAFTAVGGDTPSHRNLVSNNGTTGGGGNNADGIRLINADADNNFVQGNYVGTDKDGDTDLGNAGDGVELSTGANNNTIGGDNGSPGGNCTGECNLISGNDQNGIRVAGAASTPNLITGNYIGTTVTGNVDRGNTLDGIFVEGTPDLTIGGTTAAERNVISGNDDNGLRVLGSSDTREIVIGNYIGLGSDGDTDVGNTDDGVLLVDAAENTIGGDDPSELNVISGNGSSGTSSDGVAITGSGSKANEVIGNYIGTDATGELDRGNNGNGVLLSGAAAGTLPARPNHVGTPTADTGNLISGNASNGVSIVSGASGNFVRNNIIGLNKDGDVDVGNTASGVNAASDSTAVGGSGTGARNVISGNDAHGVQVQLDSANTVVEGNYIGTDDTGSGDFGNSQNGVLLAGDAQTIVGGTTGTSTTECAGACNVISGNNQDGVNIISASHLIEGNYIGLNVDGDTDVGNTAHGVHTDGGGDGVVIGGVTPEERNVISGNNQDGINASNGSDDNTIHGNYIGTDDTGESDIANTGDGVSITGGTINDVGGIDPGMGNLISGNGDNGVLLSGATVTGNRVRGNLIGTDKDGDTDLGNTDDGVRLETGASGNFIGGLNGGARNVISENNSDGVELNGAGSDNLVRGNSIGTDDDGDLELGNGADGVHVEATDDTDVGGTDEEAGNVISDNDGDGVELDSSDDTVLQWNLIGTDQDGTADLGNGAHGVLVEDDSDDNIIGDPADGNTIRFNGDDGVAVTQDDSDGNVIRANSIDDNGGLGIDLDNDGVTLNDTGPPHDTDTGPNQEQNFPVLERAEVGSTNLEGELESAPLTDYDIDVYAVPVCDDPSGHGEGREHLGTRRVTTDPDGFSDWGASFSEEVPIGEFVSATATDVDTGDTSEFSACEEVVEEPGGGGGGGGGGGPVPECRDGVDNDDDGLIDHPDDPGCSSRSDDSESPDPTPSPAPTPTGTESPSPSPSESPSPSPSPGVTACSDGIDNDGDGLVDGADTGCKSPEDDEEGGIHPRCGMPNVICGTDGDDVLIGTAGNDIIIGGAGNDSCSGRGGNDLIICGAGRDLIRGGGGHDRLRSTTGADRIFGGKGRDTLRGGKGRDFLAGGRGRDRLVGGAGPDTLVGGKGADLCRGGRGRDRLRRC